MDDGEPFYWHEWKNAPIRPHPILGREKMMPGFVPVDLDQLGSAGVRERLDRSNLWSGRGEHASLDTLADTVIANNDRRMEDRRKQLGDGLRDPLRSIRNHARGNARVGYGS